MASQPASTTGRIRPDEPVLAIRADSVAVRAFDLSVCMLVLPAVLLVGALTALLIYIDSPGSVFYRSTRVGRGGQNPRDAQVPQDAPDGKGRTADDER